MGFIRVTYRLQFSKSMDGFLATEVSIIQGKINLVVFQSTRLYVSDGLQYMLAVVPVKEWTH